MAIHNEIEFEKELCDHLAAHGWLYSENDTGYDKTRALFPEDVLGWLTDTQPAELAKVGNRDQLLDRIAKQLDAPLESGGGTLNMLRGTVKHVSSRFSMCQFRPNTSLNETTEGNYGGPRPGDAPGALLDPEQQQASIWCSSSTESRSPPPN